MRVAVLASGSSGNAILVSADDTHLLVDAGISARRVTRALHALDVRPEDLRAVLVTHEHGDHVSGLGPLVRRLHVPVYATRGTLGRIRRLIKGGGAAVVVDAGSTFEVGTVNVSPFAVSHDCVDPVGYSFDDGGVRVVVATDLGVVGRSVRDHLSRADCIVLESNHDERMLLDGPYPWHLKRRILSNTGHLSNDAAAREIDLLCSGRLSSLVLAHISHENNRPDLAVAAAAAILDRRGRTDVAVTAASRDEPTDPVEIAGPVGPSTDERREEASTVCAG